MGNDVVLASALRSNLLSLQSTQKNIDATQLRLATGLRINSALDNPQSFFTAKALNNRAGDLARLLDGISQSIRSIEQANTGIETLSTLLEQADSIAQEAQAEIRASEGFTRVRGNVDLRGLSDLTSVSGGGTIVDGTSDSFDVTVTESDGTQSTITIDIDANETVDNIVADINSSVTLAGLATARVTSAGYLEIASKQEGATIRLSASAVNGMTAAGFSALGLDTIVSSEDDGAGGLSPGGTAVAGSKLLSGVSAAATVNGAYEASAVLGGAGADYLSAGGDDVNIVLTIDGTTTDLGQVTDTDTIQDVVDRVNNAGIGSKVTASFNTATGRIELAFANTVGQVELQFTDNGASTVNFGFGAGASDGALAGNLSSEFFTFDGVNVNVDQYEIDFNSIRDQIDDLVADSNYRGINLLGGDDMTTYFNETRTSSLVTEGVDFTALGLGIDRADFTNVANAQLSIDRVRDAVLAVRQFGQTVANDLSIVQSREDFTERTINTLRGGSDDLVIADQNEEGANLLALQTRQALGTTALSLAAESQRSVLRLF